MAGQKRAKEVARARHDRQQERRAQKRRQRNRNTSIAIGVVLAITLAGIAFAFWPEGSADQSSSDLATATASAPPAPVPTPEGVTCSEATGRPQTGSFEVATPQKLKTPSTWVLKTNCGTIDVALDVGAAPVTTNAIAFLTNSGWYTDNQCSRLTTEGLFVVQCGAREPDGTSDAGLRLPRENLPQADPKAGFTMYSAGTVAMAANQQGISGSQFFIVYKDSMLGPEYSRFGRVTSGLNVVEYVAALGVSSDSPDPADGPPATPLVIQSTSIRVPQ